MVERSTDPPKWVAKRGFGGFTRQNPSTLMPKSKKSLVWTNSLSTADPRHTKPSQARKFVNTSSTPMPASAVPSYWLPVNQASQEPSREAQEKPSREAQEKKIFLSCRATRCEDWSTLRQMLPSRGYHKGCQPPKWGTSPAITPTFHVSRPMRYPKINSLMTT